MPGRGEGPAGFAARLQLKRSVAPPGRPLSGHSQSLYLTTPAPSISTLSAGLSVELSSLYTRTGSD
jgi:hypothetical protein